MNPIILGKTLLGYRLALLLMAAAMVGFGMLIPSTYDAFGGRYFEDFARNMPKGLQAFLKSEVGSFVGSGAQGYVSTGFRHPIFLIVGAAFTIAAASGALAREVERRTIYLILSRPTPRYELVVSRFLGMALGLALLLAAMMVGTTAGVALSQLSSSVNLARFVLVAANAFLLLIALGGVAFFISALASDGGKAIALSAGFAVASFFLDFLAGLWEPLRSLGPASIYHYYDPVNVAITGRVPILHVAVLLAVAAASFTAAVMTFQRRDIA
ncbi:MAG: ABC transporter permease subunit [Chloroflexi bacterium]|nr:ABC transporter permease subunit [Chloroflexota bacterium]